MVENILKIEGMKCSHCEMHIQDVLRKAFSPKKVSASASKGEAILILDRAISEEEAHKAIDPTGYRLIGLSSKPYEKKGLFSFFKK